MGFIIRIQLDTQVYLFVQFKRGLEGWNPILTG